MHHQGAFVPIAQNHVIDGQTCACIFCHFSCLWLDMPQDPQVGPDPRILRRPLAHRMARRKPHVTLRPQGFARMFQPTQHSRHRQCAIKSIGRQQIL